MRLLACQQGFDLVEREGLDLGGGLLDLQLAAGERPGKRSRSPRRPEPLDQRLRRFQTMAGRADLARGVHVGLVLDQLRAVDFLDARCAADPLLELPQGYTQGHQAGCRELSAGDLGLPAVQEGLDVLLAAIPYGSLPSRLGEAVCPDFRLDRRSIRASKIPLGWTTGLVQSTGFRRPICLDELVELFRDLARRRRRSERSPLAPRAGVRQLSRLLGWRSCPPPGNPHLVGVREGDR